jgi:hypothetical protein
MTSLVEGEVEDLALVAYVIMHMLYLGTSQYACKTFVFRSDHSSRDSAFQSHD